MTKFHFIANKRFNEHLWNQTLFNRWNRIKKLDIIRPAGCCVLHTTYVLCITLVDHLYAHIAYKNVCTSIKLVVYTHMLHYVVYSWSDVMKIAVKFSRFSSKEYTTLFSIRYNNDVDTSWNAIRFEYLHKPFCVSELCV